MTIETTTDSEGYRPTDDQLARRDGLVHLLGQAMAYSEEMAAPAAVFHQVTRAAVDVTCGCATDADLHAAAHHALCLLEQMVEAQPLRRALADVISDLSRSGSVHCADVLSHLDVDFNALEEGGDPPRKQRAA